MTDARLDVAIVGAGFSGLYMLHRARGLGLAARVFEQAPEIGGTWYWNRYPGARCDVESIDYSYSFSPELEQEWDWTERFATQPEILRYLHHVADRFDLRRDVQLSTRVIAARYRAAAARWEIETDTGQTWSARYCVMAAGCLSSVNRPAFAGLDTFGGDWYHTARWPAGGVDFSGRRVGIIGTGSTGIQAIPEIARQAEQLLVFQRTPNFSVPARNRPLSAAQRAEVKRSYRERRRISRESATGIPATHPEIAPQRSALSVDAAQRHTIYEQGWDRGGPQSLLAAFNDITRNAHSNDTLADFVRAKIAQTVRDQAVARRLMPRDHPIGTKRICVDTDYYDTFNRANVTLVDVREAPIVAITERGLRTTAAEYELDALVFATGFDAITGALMEIDIRGRDGVCLRDVWAAGPRTYLGLGTAGFPNLFLVTGPGSPSVLSNMIVSIEQHVGWIADCIAHLEDHGVDEIEVSPEAQEAWVQHVNEVAGQTLFLRASSWFLGANIPGKPRVFMPYLGGVGNYRRICEEVAADGYRGFVLSRHRAAA